MTHANGSELSGENRARRDDDGGVPDMQGDALPAGITSRLVLEYSVGPYRYTDLAQAIAERDRQRRRAKT